MSEWQEIKLTHGLSTLVDLADLPLVAGRKWHAQRRRDGDGFYAVDGSGQRMHRVLMNPSLGQIVDHIDGNGLDNRRKNLRCGTQSGNCVNRRRTPGVHLRGARPKKGKWQAYIKFQGRQRSLGYYDTEAQAHEAYMVEAKRLHGDWMPLPSPPQES